MPHPALEPGNTALITGAASGIGLAAAERFAQLGLNVILVDRDALRLKTATETLREEAPDITVIPALVDISDKNKIYQLAAAHPDVSVLMNNAAIGNDSSVLDPANWDDLLNVNLWGVIHGCQAFVPAMIASEKPGLIINTGSKQGITTPPGNPAYNVSKAAVKVFTEALQHELRTGENPDVTAHLLIPGFVWTGMTSKGVTEKPKGAWTPEETIDFMLESLEKGDFYILCPDNDVPRRLDEQRMEWAVLDIIDNRPPLSRWHPDYAEDFKVFVKET